MSNAERIIVKLPHGPYYYAYWKERISSNDAQSATVWKLKKKYIGSYLPENEEQDTTAMSRR